MLKLMKPIIVFKKINIRRGLCVNRYNGDSSGGAVHMQPHTVTMATADYRPPSYDNYASATASSNHTVTMAPPTGVNGAPASISAVPVPARYGGGYNIPIHAGQMPMNAGQMPMIAGQMQTGVYNVLADYRPPSYDNYASATASSHQLGQLGYGP